jgi:hypothetical protein
MQTPVLIIFKIEFDISASSYGGLSTSTNVKVEHVNVPKLPILVPTIFRDLCHPGRTFMQSLFELVGNKQSTTLFLLKEGSFAWLNGGDTLSSSVRLLVLPVPHRRSGQG